MKKTIFFSGDVGKNSNRDQQCSQNSIAMTKRATGLEIGMIHMKKTLHYGRLVITKALVCQPNKNKHIDTH